MIPLSRTTLVALLLLSLSVPASAAGGIVLVSGETKTRFEKLATALAAAKPGDRVVLESGEHRGAFVLPAGVRLEGKSTLVPAGSRPALVSGGKGASVHGLTFRGPPMHSGRKSGAAVLLDVTGGGVRVRNCRFVGGAAVGVRVGEKAMATIEKCLFLDLPGNAIHLIGTDSTIRHCRIRGSGWHGLRIDRSRALVTRTVIESSERSGIYVAGEDESTIEHCHIASGVFGGIAVYGRGHTRILENSFVGNLRSAVAIDIASSVTVRGNVFVDNSIGVSRFETAHGVHFFPDLYALGRPDIADNAHCGNDRDYSNLATDPVGYRAEREFRDPPAEDYRPAPGSRLLREGFPCPEAGLGDASRLPPAPPPPSRTGEFGTVVGRVVDEEGRPLSDAGVVLGARRTQRVARTRRDGSYELRDVPVGRWLVTGCGAGYLSRIWPGGVEVRPGETTTLPDLRLARDHPIRGLVGTGRGAPAPGAVVYALSAGEPNAPYVLRGIAGWNGKFRVSFLPAGRRTLLAFRRLKDAGLAVVHAYPDVPTGSAGWYLTRGVERVRIRITDAVAGRARDWDLMVWGKPDAGGELLLTRADRIGDLCTLPWPLDLEGREIDLLTLLPPGTYDVVARRFEHRRVVRVAHASGVVVRPGDSRRVELVAERAGRIAGTVVDEEGKPVAGAIVTSAEVGPAPDLFRVAGRDPPRLYRTLSDAAGAFRIDAVQPGDRRLRVHAAGHREQIVTVPGVEPRKTARIRVELAR